MDKQSLETLRKKLPAEECVCNLADLFKMFGDSTRTKILCCLQVRDLNVGEIAEGVAVGKDEHGALGGRDGLFKRFVEGGKFCKIGRRVALIECGIAFVHGAELLLDGGNERFCVLHGEPDVLVGGLR